MEKSFMEEQEDELKTEFAEVIEEEKKAEAEEVVIEPEEVEVKAKEEEPPEPEKVPEPGAEEAPYIKLQYEYGDLPPELRKPFDQLTPEQKNIVYQKRLSDTHRSWQQMHAQMNAILARQQKKEPEKKEEPLDEETKAWKGQPGFEKAIAEVLKPHQERQAKLEKTLNFFLLKEAVPDVIPIVQSKQYNDWLLEQPPSIQVLHASDQLNDNIDILRLFQKSALYDQLKKTRQIKSEQKKETIAAAATISSANRGVPVPKPAKDAEMDEIDAMDDDEILEHSDIAVGLRSPKRQSNRR